MILTTHFDNAIGGTGSVVKSGDKTLTLSGANSYTGGTTIR
ncbi:autotransporter-associated beta strand repeat-containing protein, partial [Salmonella enterica]